MLHYTYDEYSEELRLMKKVIQDQLDIASKDESYFDIKTIMLHTTLRDSLATALVAARKLNKISEAECEG